MKWTRNRCVMGVLACLMAFTLPGNADAGNLMTQEILPSETDPSITRFNGTSEVLHTRSAEVVDYQPALRERVIADRIVQHGFCERWVFLMETVKKSAEHPRGRSFHRNWLQLGDQLLPDFGWVIGALRQAASKAPNLITSGTD